jgi:hypothetical protein
MSTFAPATSIDEVLTALDAIICRAYDERDRTGYFAALYRSVTAAVKAGIAAGSFEDGPRMGRLDVVFANRYLDALYRYQAGQPLSLCWRAAFDAVKHRRVVIIQHLLLGMNAHINLDLGIAAAEICPGDALPSLQNDFNAINTVLASLETGVEQEVCSLSPWIDRLDHIDPNAGRVVANFSIDRARECSWKTAQRLSVLTGAARDAAIAELDAEVALLAHVVERPVGLAMNFNLALVRLREVWDVQRVIRTLYGRDPSAA